MTRDNITLLIHDIATKCRKQIPSHLLHINHKGLISFEDLLSGVGGWGGGVLDRGGVYVEFFMSSYL